MNEYGTSVETSASPERVWQVWSDTATWVEWNPNFIALEMSGPFVSGSSGMMKHVRSGQHKIQLVDVEPGHRFALETTVIPGTRFRFNCRIEPSGGKTRISQSVEVKGLLSPILAPILGPQIAKDFGTILGDLAKKAEAS